MNPWEISIIVIANIIFGASAIPLYIKYARHKRIVDIPNHRSSHTKATPRGGGIFLTLGTILLYALKANWDGDFLTSLPFLLIISSVAILGFIDDLTPLPSALRLGIQIALATTLLYFISTTSTFSILGKDLSSSSLMFWLAAIPITIWTVGCLNIYNFMDGIDGIATLQGIVASTTWIVIAFHSENISSLLLSLSLLGGLVAFLLYNLAPAKVFMGDCASSFLGFAFATLPLLHSKHLGADLWQSINLGAIILLPFLFDGSYTLIRRIIRKENVLEAHRTHLYQRWVQKGRSHTYVSTAYAFWALICSGCTLSTYFQSIPLSHAWGIACLPGVFLLIHSRTFHEQQSAT